MSSGDRRLRQKKENKMKDLSISRSNFLSHFPRRWNRLSGAKFSVASCA